MVQRRAMKITLARQANRLLSLIGISPLAHLGLATRAHLRLERISLLEWVEHLSAHLAIECATSELAGVDVMWIQR